MFKTYIFGIAISGMIAIVSAEIVDKCGPTNISKFMDVVLALISKIHF